MKEHPILFTDPMVRAILDGSKTQTRRVARQPLWEPVMERAFAPGCQVYRHADGRSEVRPSWRVGHRLWVRETWGCPPADHPLVPNGRKPTQGDRIVYAADPADAWQWRGGPGCSDFVWRPSIFMPRWASRITLEVVNVRPERLHDITEEDARAEGVADRAAFMALWDTINAKRGRGWESNPWVWVIEFRREAQA